MIESINSLYLILLDSGIIMISRDNDDDNDGSSYDDNYYKLIDLIDYNFPILHEIAFTCSNDKRFCQVTVLLADKYF